MNKQQSGEALVTIVSTFEQLLREEGAVNGVKWCMEVNGANAKSSICFVMMMCSIFNVTTSKLARVELLS